MLGIVARSTQNFSNQAPEAEDPHSNKDNRVPKTEILIKSIVEEVGRELASFHQEIENIAFGNLNLLQHALHHARQAKDKFLNVLASWEEDVKYPVLQSVFRQLEGDDSLRRQKIFLEKWKT